MFKSGINRSDHAKEWNIGPNRVSLMGFSAGATLAGMSATQWNGPQTAEILGVESNYIRPGPAVIAYGCWVNPGASQFPKSCPPQLDTIHYIGGHVCPLFIWHNQKDK